MAKPTITSYSACVLFPAIKLSKRLETIKNLVPIHSDCVWDICCDHGHIGKSLLRHKRKVIFLDQIPSIMDKLALQLKATDIPGGYEILTQDAKIVNYKNDHSNCYIVCGIGGDLGRKILEQINLTIKTNDTCIVSVHKNNIKFRTYLNQVGFRLLSETLVKDNSKFYEILLISKEHGKEITPLGSSIWDNITPDHHDYLNQQLEYYQTKSNYDPSFLSIFNEYSLIAKKAGHFTS